MPISKDFSVEDEAYIHAVSAEPKMTMDEVGADIEAHGHVPVTKETATQDPFTAKGSISYALDEAFNSTKGESKLMNPSDDFRDETKDDVEGTTSTPQGIIQPVQSNKEGEGLEPTVQQDEAVHVKDSLTEALEAITMDGAEEIEAKPPVGKDLKPDYTNYSEESASHIDYKAPDLPKSLGGSDEKPDENGLVYVSATFTIDPSKYVSNNYRPSNMGKMPDAVAELKKASGNMKKQAVNPEEEAAMSDLGTPEAKEAAASPDEPSEQQEKEAAKDANKEQAEEEKEEGQPVIPPESKNTKPAQDEALETVVLDYATFIDGSSFICFDEVSDIDYSKIAMDAGIKKAPTRENCQTTFAQCRAKNPLFCRFHGPKLLEADIKTAIKSTVGSGCVVQVTKDKNSKNRFTFRLTVGCPPSKKKMVEKTIHWFLTQNPGISSSTEDWNLVGKHKQTLEFEMDILQADNPPQKNSWADQAKKDTKEAIKSHKKQDVVGETASALEKNAAKGEKWQTVDEDVENEWADLVDKTVHKSLLGNNDEFMANFNKIANQFDAAHDKGDANGLKQALEALKDEIGKYDENGKNKPDAEAAEAEETTEEPQEEGGGEKNEDVDRNTLIEENEETETSANEASPNSATSGEGGSSKKKEQNEVAGLSDEDVNPWYWKAQKQWFPLMDKAMEMWGTKEWDEKIAPISHKYGVAYKAEDTEGVFNAIEELKNVLDGKQSAANKSEETVLPSPVQVSKANKPSAEDEKKKAFDALKKALKGTGYEDDSDWEYNDYGGDSKEVMIASSDSGVLEALIGGDGGITYLIHDDSGPHGNTKDPKEAIEDFEKNYGGKPPAQSNGGNAISSLQNELSGLMDKMQSIGATTDADVFAMQHMCNNHMEELNTAKSILDDLDEKISSANENPTGNAISDAMNMKLLEEAKKYATSTLDEKVAKMKGSIRQFTDSLYSYEKATMETAKKGAADSVEQTVKNLGVYVFGGKRPPQGVDSVTDYLDYLKDEFESGATGTLTPDEQSEIEDTYFLEDAYKATKAASKAMDDAIEAFKDKMDEVPSQGEDYGTYQSDIEQMQKAVASQAVEVMAAFGAYKSALEKCKHDADAAQKLADSKKKLEGGGAQANKPATASESKDKSQSNSSASLSDDGKKAKIAAMSPKQKVEAAVKIFKKKLAANPNDADAKAKLAKYEAMLAKLAK